MSQERTTVVSGERGHYFLTTGILLCIGPLNDFFPECLLHYRVIYLIWWSKVTGKT